MSRKIAVVIAERTCRRTPGQVCTCTGEIRAASALHFYLRQVDEEARQDPLLSLAFHGELSGSPGSIQAVAERLADSGYGGVLVKQIPCH